MLRASIARTCELLRARSPGVTYLVHVSGRGCTDLAAAETERKRKLDELVADE